MMGRLRYIGLRLHESLHQRYMLHHLMPRMQLLCQGLWDTPYGQAAFSHQVFQAPRVYKTSVHLLKFTTIDARIIPGVIVHPGCTTFTRIPFHINSLAELSASCSDAAFATL